MIKLFNTIKCFLQQQSIILEKIAVLEAQITNIEKANLVMLTKLLQLNQTNQPKDKRDSKNEILLTSPKDLNAGKTPTYH